MQIWLTIAALLLPAQIRFMRLTDFQDKHEGDLTGPALEEIRSRQQILKQQLMVPPATGESTLKV